MYHTNFASVLVASASLTLIPVPTQAQVSISLKDDLVATLTPHINVGYSSISQESHIRHVVDLQFSDDAAITKADEFIWWSQELSGDGFMSELFTYNPPTGILDYEIFFSLEQPMINGTVDPTTVDLGELVSSTSLNMVTYSLEEDVDSKFDDYQLLHLNTDTNWTFLEASGPKIIMHTGNKGEFVESIEGPTNVKRIRVTVSRLLNEVEHENLSDGYMFQQTQTWGMWYNPEGKPILADQQTVVSLFDYSSTMTKVEGRSDVEVRYYKNGQLVGAEGVSDQIDEDDLVDYYYSDDENSSERPSSGQQEYFENAGKPTVSITTVDIYRKPGEDQDGGAIGNAGGVLAILVASLASLIA